MSNLLRTVPHKHSSVSVGVTSTAVLAAGLAANVVKLVNDSANIIYVTYDGNAAVVGQGMRLNANGGSDVMDEVAPTAAINAIATGASSNLLVTYG